MDGGDRSRDEFVFVDEPADDIASADGAGQVGGGGGRPRWGELEAAMRPGRVVVVEVLGEDRLQVAARENEQVVEAVLGDGADPALGERVRPWGANGREDGLDTDRREGPVEAGRELGVSVPDEKPHPPSGLLKLRGEAAGELGHSRPVRVGGDAEQVHGAPFDLDHEEHVVAPQQHVVDGEEVGRQDAFRLGVENSTLVGPARRRAGGRPWRPRTVATLPFDPVTLSLFSSPTIRS